MAFSDILYYSYNKLILFVFGTFTSEQYYFMLFNLPLSHGFS